MSKNEENSNRNSNKFRKENNPFSLPEGYFGSFGKKMMHKIELAEELKEFPLLSSLEKKLPFVTPENYFAVNEIKAELTAYPKLSAIKPAHGFEVPELYFETSAKDIKTKVEVTEELKVYPTLYSISKENSFVTPQEYFEGLGHEVHEKIFETQEGSGVVKMLFPKAIGMVFNKRTAYAIAAMLVISLGIYFYDSGEESTNCNGIACLDKSEIMRSNEFLNNLDEETLMQMVNTEKLSKGLQENLKETQSTKEEDTKEKEDYVLENVDVNDIVDEI
jgi:hypothetical protein